MITKFKKMIKGEKGFTLVELLAVIVILGIIVAIAIPAIGSIIDGAGEKADAAEVQLIIDAARLYEIEEGSTFPVTVESLIEDGYLDERQGDAPSGSVTRNAAGELEFNRGS
ncbi:prepilin-type N-terminal cleavage/methylation domain-containing protein [Amphibacillus marinus]|uniref:Prepilin-type N-terminal cleavage/methylation domain-containing protein n=1 Tax=Amphibacillus marinus TaxID=872970 RepID=A0A1H8TS80_9BACI|nr:prepilin-type N-terminal cleavage/methylation domain-containing protein [Amphibacillus marinus]SEO93696.1 prepilin-type N-terminal cleavage/methylation domain-containing protein [Amphibacillus marinus]